MAERKELPKLRDCYDLMLELEECHQLPFSERLYGCNHIKEAVNQCMRHNRLARRAMNLEEAKARKARTEERRKKTLEEIYGPDLILLKKKEAAERRAAEAAAGTAAAPAER
ncbi:uncharacterized protein V1510DRAFT_415246 [Dipodascopsis tothii]|uniref:uncharacterized protein n=1 Tax=Dipodascopsis tothii TaxID=44089 RepID=UPI0034CDDB5C